MTHPTFPDPLPLSQEDTTVEQAIKDDQPVAIAQVLSGTATQIFR